MSVKYKFERHKINRNHISILLNSRETICSFGEAFLLKKNELIVISQHKNKENNNI